jgi:hypothetical protein
MHDVQPFMSFEQDLIPYPSSSGKNAREPDLFFAPDPQLAFAPSPESFDREVDNEEFDLELSFKEFDDFFATFGDTIPVAPTPSAVTDLTDSAESVYSSQYSIPSEIESRGSVYDGLYSTHASVYSAAFSDPLPSIPPPSPAAVQESASPVHVIPDEAHGPVKPFKCPLCPFCESDAMHFIIGSFLLLASARKHNLHTHVVAHDKERSKRFGCDTCGNRFTRKHDLRRHRETIHKEQLSSSSPSSSISKRILKRTLDPMPEQPDLSHRGITLNGGPAPMLSAYPDYDAVIDVPENIIAWFLGV